MQDSKELFVLRRSCWFGQAKSQDVEDAFNVSSASARRVLDRAVQSWPQVLLRVGRSGVFKKESEDPPKEASAQKMMELLEQKASYCELGLTEEEIGVTWSNFPYENRPLGNLDVLLNSIIYNKKSAMKGQNKFSILKILYVGLRKNDIARWRKIIANGIEYNGKIWKLMAQDLDSPGFSQKVYVFSRILDIRDYAGKKPKEFKFQDVPKLKKKHIVRLNTKLTEDQKKALSNELHIKNNIAYIPKNEFFDFKRYYCGDKEGMESIIWPPVMLVE